MSDRMENLDGIDRRQFVKGVSAATVAAAAGLSGCTGDGGGGSGDGEMDIPDDPDSAVDGVSLSLAIDEGHNTNPFGWFNDSIREDTGVEVGEINGFGFTNLFSNLMTEFTSNSGAFDLVSFYPQYLGTFAANGHLTPLDDMMEIDGWDPDFDDMLKPFRQMYTQWGGNTYALPIDGDVLMLVYRRDLFEQHDIEVPETWSEFNEVARYFTEETDDIDHGVATFGKRGNAYGWFLNRFGGLGGVYFDEDMNPQINTEAGRRALESWQETIEYSPDDTASYGYPELRDAFTNGNVAMVIQWTDVPKKAAVSDATRGNWGGAPVPGWEDGRAASAMPVGRVLGVPSGISSEQKLAAYRFAQTFTLSEYSTHMVSDPGCGEDPFRTSQLSNPEAFTQENPYRDAPEESVAFESMESAEQYTSAVQATLEQGYPVPYWPGSQDYIEALDIEMSRFVSGEVGVEEALENVESEWESIVEDLGREQQQEYYSNVIDAWQNAGIWE